MFFVNLREADRSVMRFREENTVVRYRGPMGKKKKKEVENLRRNGWGGKLPGLVSKRRQNNGRITKEGIPFFTATKKRAFPPPSP